MTRLVSFLIAAMLLIGIYWPTSAAGQQSRWLWAVPGLVLLAAAGLLILWHGMVKVAFACSAAAMAFLLFFTLITPLWTVTPGTLLPYAALILLLCTDLSRVVYDSVLRIAWTVMNVVNLGLSALVVADFQPAKEFLRANYSAFYDSLVPMMLAEGKPILMFGSHSIAAFFFFVCFYLHLKSSVARRSSWCFLAAVAYLSLLVLLKSVSAYFLFAAGLVLLAFQIRRRHAWPLLAAAAVAVIIAAAMVSEGEWQQVTTDVQKVWRAPESGFRGRYDESGVLAADFEFIRTNPLRGIGIGFSESLWYGDSGPVEFLLRGSVPLVLAVYGAFWFFLTRNILSRGTAITVFVIYFAFEVAYSNLLYLRTICMLPFVIAHLNGLPRGRTAEKPRRLTAPETQVAATQELASC